MPAAEQPTAPPIPLNNISHVSTTPSTPTSSSESRAVSSAEFSRTSTAPSTVSPTSSPPLSGRAVVPHSFTIPGQGTADTSTQHSPWARYVFINLRDHFRTVQASTKVTLPTRFHLPILTAPNLTTTPTSNPPSQAFASPSDDINQLGSPPVPSSARTVSMLNKWWDKSRKVWNFKDRMGGLGGVAMLMMTIFGLVYYAHRTDKLARWTAAKDYLEQCRNELSANISTPQCRAALAKHLLPPPYQPDNFYTSTTKRDRLSLTSLWTRHNTPRQITSLDPKSVPGAQNASLLPLHYPLGLEVLVAAMLCGLWIFLWRLYSPAKALWIRRRKALVEDSPARSVDSSHIIRKALIQETGIRRRRIFELESELESEQEYEQELHQQPQEYEFSDVEISSPIEGSKARESDYVAMRNAMQRGDVSGLKALLDFCCDPEARDTDGSPIFHFFAVHGGPQVDNESQITMLDLLLDYGAQPNTMDAKGRNVLCFARTTADVAVDDYLLSKLVDVNHKDGNSWTPLHYALRYQDPARLKLYLESRAIRTDFDFEPLHFLCHFTGSEIPTSLSGTTKENEERTINCIKLLLDHDLANMSPDETECTPLHHAAEKGQILVIDALLDYKTSMADITNSSSRCDIIEIFDEINLEPVDSWCDHLWGSPLEGTPLDVAVRAGQVDATTRLLDEDPRFTLARIKSRPEDLLKIACSRAPDTRNYLEMVQLLAPLCKSVHWLCLAMSAYHVSEDVVRILLHHGAEVDINFIMSCACASRVDDQKRKQPLIPFSFQREREAVIDLLIEAGISLDASHIGPGPLQMAAGMYPTPAVLLQPAAVKPTLPSQLNRHKRSYLDPDEELFRYLLSRGANPMRIDSSGKRPPLHLVFSPALKGLEDSIADRYYDGMPNRQPRRRDAFMVEPKSFGWKSSIRIFDSSPEVSDCD